MKKTYSKTIFIIIVLATAIFAAICWHSVQEIHYLKSFFPRQFSVQEAYYASAIELIKIIIIGLPLGAIAAVCIYILRHINEEK
jgi:hypothetical protein